jgi:hypothetical protein
MAFAKGLAPFQVASPRGSNAPRLKAKKAKLNRGQADLSLHFTPVCFRVEMKRHIVPEIDKK